MNPEIFYLLKVNGILTAGYLLYILLLQQETFYSWKRYYFLGLIPLALILPFLEFSKSVEPLLIIRPTISPLTIDVSGKDSGLRAEDWFFILTVIGTFFLLTKLGIQLYSLWKMNQKSIIASPYKGCKVVHVRRIINPFSFFHSIYINPELHLGPEQDSILSHEYIHIREGHTWDILLHELICACCWYNPFVWLLRAAVKQNIEFYTDKQVLKTGYDKRHYQHDLLKVSQLPAFIRIANNFNFNHLKSSYV